MAEVSSVNVASGSEEKGPEGLSQELPRPGTTISRVKLFDTMVDTFLQKLVAAGRHSAQVIISAFTCEFLSLPPSLPLLEAPGGLPVSFCPEHPVPGGDQHIAVTRDSLTVTSASTSCSLR